MAHNGGSCGQANITFAIFAQPDYPASFCTLNIEAEALDRSAALPKANVICLHQANALPMCHSDES
jgi:hypothetical protein